MGGDSFESGECPAFELEHEARDELELARVKDGTWRSVGRIRRTLAEKVGRAGAARRAAIERAKIGRAVVRIEVVNVDGVEQVERFDHQLNFESFANRDGALQA